MNASAAILVRVVPRAGRTAIGGKRGDAWLVRLAAAPVEGAANAALVDFLSDQLGLPRRSVSIVSGEKSRDKRIRVDGLSSADVESRLTALAAVTR